MRVDFLPINGRVKLLEAVRQTAFFRARILTVQEREQRQDCVDDVENEVNPVELIHNVTPSLSRGEPSRFKSGGTV